MLVSRDLQVGQMLVWERSSAMYKHPMPDTGTGDFSGADVCTVSIGTVAMVTVIRQGVNGTGHFALEVLLPDGRLFCNVIYDILPGFRIL